MSFHESAENIYLEDGHILHAQLRNGDGDMCDCTCDLNDYIGNEEGNFVWGGTNFAETAENISFNLEGDGQPILRAELRDSEGNVHSRDVNLCERLGNDDGSFSFN